ncbi:VC0807 family protein [Paenisporosarcina cavernae]|uniref:VC0807 family protein n=1 Tax=Paenisporosarcina cavernae TaxID=2320858 RepID=UPI0019691C94|nr:VC0807 family protein [Paenisporosarcina cavernae]
MKSKILVLDILFYVALPLIVWNLLRDTIGDYYAMLLTGVPAIIYSLYRFYEMKRVNVTGIFILASLFIGPAVDLLSGSAIRLLWNNVILTIVIAAFFIGTVVARKPLALYFALDVAELQGYDRTFSYRLYTEKKLFIVFQAITLLFALRSLIMAAVNSWLISTYGVEAFDEGIVLKQVLNWAGTFVIVIGFVYISKIIQDSPEIIQKLELELGMKYETPEDVESTSEETSTAERESTEVEEMETRKDT